MNYAIVSNIDKGWDKLLFSDIKLQAFAKYRELVIVLDMKNC